MMKKLLAIMVCTALSMTAIAQCEEYISGQTLQKGMFIRCGPVDDSTKLYVAEVISASGTSFSCRFLHSGSIYNFVDFKKISAASDSKMHANVQSSRGGAYTTGTIFYLNVLMRDPDICDLSSTSSDKFINIIATFVADNKSYLGWMKKDDDGNGYVIQFLHSLSTYAVDNSFKVTATQGGGYKIGSQLKIVHARLLKF